MNIKHIVAIAIAVTSLTSVAEQYRIKFAATVDIIEDGKVVGQKRLKAGTFVEVVESESEGFGSVQKKESATAKPSSGKLRLSKISPIIFKNEKPAGGAVFNAEVELRTYYTGPFEGKNDVFWNVYVYAKNEKWSAGESFTGYARKTDAIGRQIKKFLEDGERHKCKVKIVPVKAPYHDDLVMIEAIEPLFDNL